MALTEHERRELAGIEQRLSGDDPKFAAKLTRPSVLAFLSNGTMRALGVFAAYVLGLLAMIGGVTWSSVPLVALGAVVCASVFAGLLVSAWRGYRR